MIVDFHTHAFPDELAERAILYLEEEGDIKAFLDGKISSLLRSMDRAGVNASVVASITTKPGQFKSILAWSETIASDRIIPFPSVHPYDPSAVDQVTEVKKAGFCGIKMHPYYQNFFLDEERLQPIMNRIQQEGLILLLHTGYDLAFERIKKADPARVLSTISKFPELKLVTSHFGGWEDWDDVERLLVGRKIYMDTSHSMPFIGKERAQRFLNLHPAEYSLFGTDSPWDDQLSDRELIKQMALDPEREKLLMGENACRLLGLHPVCTDRTGGAFKGK
ncbi:MAG: amidohydrolase family protein [Spirochaetales bacterium]|jgi:uncharacterized protein|nr:amidohydrolase family protein [Spirochaetales bacterium]